MGVAGKAQQSCGSGGKPAPGVWELQCHVKLTLEGRGSWSMTPVLTSSSLSEAKSNSPTSVTHPVRYPSPHAMAAAVFVTSTSLALWIAFLAALITNFIFLVLPLPFLSFVPPPPFSLLCPHQRPNHLLSFSSEADLLGFLPS